MPNGDARGNDREMGGTDVVWTQHGGIVVDSVREDGSVVGADGRAQQEIGMNGEPVGMGGIREAVYDAIGQGYAVDHDVASEAWKGSAGSSAWVGSRSSVMTRQSWGFAVLWGNDEVGMKGVVDDGMATRVGQVTAW